MTVRMLDEKQRIGKFCKYEWYPNGKHAFCGQPVIAKAGHKPICKEHLEFIRSSRPTPLEKPLRKWRGVGRNELD